MHVNYEFENQLVHFSVKDVQMCAYLKNIKKVLPLVALENVPCSPSYLAGLMNIKGKMIPVVDFAIRLGMGRHKNYLLDTPIILFSNEEQEIALIVDNVIGLTDFDETKLQRNKDFNKIDSPFLATIADNSNSSLLINTHYLFAIDLIKDNKLYASKDEK